MPDTPQPAEPAYFAGERAFLPAALCLPAAAAATPIRGALLGLALLAALTAAATGGSLFRRWIPAWFFLPFLFLAASTTASLFTLAAGIYRYPLESHLEFYLLLTGAGAAAPLGAREIALHAESVAAALCRALTAGLWALLLLTAVGLVRTGLYLASAPENALETAVTFVLTLDGPGRKTLADSTVAALLTLGLVLALSRCVAQDRTS